MYQGTNYPDRVYWYAATIGKAREIAKKVSYELDEPTYIFFDADLSPEKRYFILDAQGNSHMITQGRKSAEVIA